MHLYKKIFLTISILTSTNLLAEYEININFESGFEFKSQHSLITNLEATNSKRQVEKIIRSQDWIKNYSIIQKPFQNKIFINIENREPIFILNNQFFYDEDLYRFKFDQSYKKIITVNAPDSFAEQILEIIIKVEKLIKVQSIKYSFTNGWEIRTENSLIRFGKNITEKKLQNFEDTMNYLFEIGKNPSIIDIRYKDGVALKYGK
tara:strand:+ start:775 stop:1389 length:615 start_codon:yes stop_codon:yes gene_type:complete